MRPAAGILLWTEVVWCTQGYVYMAPVLTNQTRPANHSFIDILYCLMVRIIQVGLFLLLFNETRDRN